MTNLSDGTPHEAMTGERHGAERPLIDDPSARCTIGLARKLKSRS
jgi:hypothetical protein